MRSLWGALPGLVALAWIGRGYVNGDIAAYVAQAWAADLSDRVVHVGYVAMATALSPLVGRDLPWALDVVNVGCAALASALSTRLGGGVWTGLAAVTLLLPWAPFAEVDVPWMAAVIASAVGVPGASALAVLVSPTALLALPWAAWHRRHLGPLVEAAAVVAVLTVASSGAWWWGERGVLQPHVWLPGRQFGIWLVTVPWLLVITGRPWRALPPLLALLPLLLAPADVPVAPLVGIVMTAAALHAPPRLRGLRAVVLAGLAGLAIVATQTRADRVSAEHETLLALLRRFDPGDGLVAPFTWGARAAVIATDDPYGLPWHPEGGFLRDQATAWAHVDGTIWVLPSEHLATRR